MGAFGELLRSRRSELRLGLRDFALRAEMDPGNLSKLERGRLNPPQDRRTLDRLSMALEWELGSEEAEQLRDTAALENGRIPEDLLEEPEVMAKMPVLLRTVHNRQLDPEEVERLIEIIREG